MGEAIDTQRVDFIEAFGVLFEQVGVPRMAGRMLGYLLIAQQPLQTADSLADALQTSRGSVSTTTRLLIQFGLVERAALPGDRRDYFRVKPGAWAQLTHASFTRLTDMRQLAERGLSVMSTEQNADRSRLEEMRDTYAFLERELLAVMNRLSQELEHRGRG
jgi:DNA-binding transcriptional regulator GbsR (MarR family)